MACVTSASTTRTQRHAAGQQSACVIPVRSGRCFSNEKNRMKKSNMSKILDWLSEGNAGTCEEISVATGIPMTIGKRLDYVRSIGAEKRPPGQKGGLKCIWARTSTEITEKMRSRPVHPKRGEKKEKIVGPMYVGASMVEAAIKSRTLLEVHWGQYEQKSAGSWGN